MDVKLKERRPRKHREKIDIFETLEEKNTIPDDKASARRNRVKAATETNIVYR